MHAVIQETWIKQPVWYKLYRTDIIRDLPFPVGKYHEDVFWTWQAVAKANKVSVFDTLCYYYVQRSGSIMAERYSLRRLDAIEAKQLRLRFVETECPQLAEPARKDLLFSCMYHGQWALRDLDAAQSAEVISRLRTIVRARCSSCGTMPLTHKCWAILARWNFALCCKVRNKLGTGL
jgi:hypothetical protein